MESAIKAVLGNAGDGWKPNKLRKKTFAKLGDTDLTWSDFKDCLEKLVRAGAVVELGDLVRLRDAPPTRAPPPEVAAPAPAKRKAEPAPDADAAEKRRRKDAAVAKKAEQAGSCSAEMSIPAGFVPFLLRKQSTKLKNIETNSKTHIQISKRGDEGAARTLTITGESEARLKTAKVLLGGMLKSFDRRAHPDQAQAGDRGKGDRPAGRGKGKGGGRGRGRGKGRGKGRGS